MLETDAVCRSAGSRTQQQAVTFRIISKDFGVAAPVQCSVNLRLNLVFGEVLVENVAEELEADRVVGFALQCASNLLQQGDVGEQSFAE